MPSTDGRPGLLLLLMVLLTVAVQGVVVAWIYPAAPMLTWILPFVFGVVVTGSAITAAAGSRRSHTAIATLSAILLSVLLGVFAAVVRACVLLYVWHRPEWSALLEPAKWWPVVAQVMDLPICCTRYGRIYPVSFHWLFLVGEQAGMLGGAVFVAIYFARHGLARPESAG